MTIEEIKETVKNSPSYNFLKTEPHLGKNIIMLGLGGSYAYGTNIDTSDIDVRGFALNSKEELLTGRNFEQVQNTETDTTIYSLHNIFSLMSNCNPNTIEILGLNDNQIIYKDPWGIYEEVHKNRHAFLSRKAIGTFGGYANAQLRRLENKEARTVSEQRRQEHILNSIKLAREASNDNLKLNLYVDKSNSEEREYEIFTDLNVNHYSFRELMSTLSEYSSIVREYDKLGKRNTQAIEHNKLGKHMMHLVRLYYMCLDILLKEEIITYREEEHDFLMKIRNGEYLDSDNHVLSEFYEIVNDLERQLHEASQKTKLPEKPDYKTINNMLMNINEKVIRGEYV